MTPIAHNQIAEPAAPTNVFAYAAKLVEEELAPALRIMTTPTNDSPPATLSIADTPGFREAAQNWAASWTQNGHDGEPWHKFVALVDKQIAEVLEGRRL
jgi:hypothetical protein